MKFVPAKSLIFYRKRKSVFFFFFGGGGGGSKPQNELPIKVLTRNMHY